MTGNDGDRRTGRMEETPPLNPPLGGGEVVSLDSPLGVERRYLAHEVRVVEQDGKRRIEGYAARFNQLSEEMWGWREVIEPGAFSQVLDNDVRALFNHDFNMILGRTPGTLVLAEDDFGLRYVVDPPDTGYAKDLLVSLERGDIDQSSFGFQVKKEIWEEPTEERPYALRRIVEIERLYDVSPVTFPAYPTTSAEARSMAEQLNPESGATSREAEEDLVGRLDVLRRRLELAEVWIARGAK